MFFFHIIDEVIMYENDCYYLAKEAKQFLLILINLCVKILLIRSTVKYLITPLHSNCYIEIFVSSSIRMGGKNVNSGDKKSKKT